MGKCSNLTTYQRNVAYFIKKTKILKRKIATHNYKHGTLKVLNLENKNTQNSNT